MIKVFFGAFLLVRSALGITASACTAEVANAENAGFYDELARTPAGIELLRLQAIRCGLLHPWGNMCPDLDVLKPFLSTFSGEALEDLTRVSELLEKHYKGRLEGQDLFDFYRARRKNRDTPSGFSPSILIVGGGFGREIDWLLQQYPNRRIVVLEFSLGLVNYLRDRYSRHRNVEIRYSSVIDLSAEDFASLEHRFGVILWMWSGVFEFSMAEKRLAMANLTRLMGRPGVLVVETNQNAGPQAPSAMRLTQRHSHYLEVEHEGYVDRLHLLDNASIAEIAKGVGLDTTILPFSYRTTVGYRSIQLFTKPSSAFRASPARQQMRSVGNWQLAQ